MSQICKYYLRGNCKYGPRCHFLHEDPRPYQSRAGYSDYSYNNYTNRSYSQNYSNRHGYSNRDYAQNYSNRDHLQNYSKEAYSRQSNKEYSSNYNRDYHRYHVDHRQNQKDTKNTMEISPSEFLEVVNNELNQFEKHHVWPLTVIAPVKEFGNIPSFKDYSPEEVRYQYYEAERNNKLFEFEENMKQIQGDIMRWCRFFKLKSAEAFDIVKMMLQKSANQNVEEMATDFVSPPSSTFSFDLKKIGSDGSAATFMPSVLGIRNDTPNFQVSNSPSACPINNQLFPSNNSAQFSIFNNEPSGQVSGVSSQFSQQPQSLIDSFSFNLNNLNSPQSSTVTQVSIPNIRGDASDWNEVVYSKLEDLSPDILEAFRAKTFTFGRVPLIPPPKQLCVG